MHASSDVFQVIAGGSWGSPLTLAKTRGRPNRHDLSTRQLHAYILYLRAIDTHLSSSTHIPHLPREQNSWQRGAYKMSRASG